MNLEDGIPSFTIEVDFLKGAKGDTGFSPRIEVASLTSAEYILRIINEDGEILTPNLKGDLSMDDYVLKEEGMGLSRNSFEDDEKQKLQELHNYDDTEIRESISTLQTNLEGKIESDINQSQQDLLDDMSKTYTGTNITGPTVEGYGRINKVYGHTIEEGSGEKSPTNPYTLKCVGDDVNLFDANKIEQTTKNGITCTVSGGIITFNGTCTQDNTVFRVVFDKLLKNENQKTSVFIEYISGTINSSGISPTYSLYQQKYLYEMYDNLLMQNMRKSSEFNNDFDFYGLYLRFNNGNVLNNYKIRIKVSQVDTNVWSPYGYGTVEIISQNGDQQSSNVVVTKPLCCLKDGDNVVAQDWIDYGKSVVHRECGYIKLYDVEPSYTTVKDNYFIAQFSVANFKVEGYVSCNFTKTIHNNTAWILEEESIAWGGSAKNLIQVKLLKSRLATVDNNGLLNFLKNIDATAIYRLRTPTIENINCSNKIVQYANETTVSNRDEAEIEVSLTNNKAISEVNGEFKNNEIQTITNENGTAIKYPDGTMICFHKKEFNCDFVANGTIFNADIENPFVFPQEFIGSSPVVTCNTANNVDYSFSMPYGIIRDSSRISNIRLIRFIAGGKGNLTLCYTAFGRWK